MRSIHVVHALIPQKRADGKIGFLVSPHEHWQAEDGQPFLGLPTKKTVANAIAEIQAGTPLDVFVDFIAEQELGISLADFAIEHEFEAVHVTMPSPTSGEPTHYQVFPIVLWVAPNEREPLCIRTQGQWLTAEEAVHHRQVSPTARAVFKDLMQRNERYLAVPPDREKQPRDKFQADALAQLFSVVSDRPSMDSQAKKWLSQNLNGVRHLPKTTLDSILDAGARAFNLRVADPYLRYQMQGQGFTWSFFTHKDSQDLHVHSAPIVEIYGVLEGRMEVWWKPYYDRGTSAWCHRILEAGDWLEVDSLQCHIVRWLGEGKGVVFKAGPGPLAEVGKLGVKGKTPCKDCPCMKPGQVLELENLGKR